MTKKIEFAMQLIDEVAKKETESIKIFDLFENDHLRKTLMTIMKNMLRSSLVDFMKLYVRSMDLSDNITTYEQFEKEYCVEFEKMAKRFLNNCDVSSFDDIDKLV